MTSLCSWRRLAVVLILPLTGCGDDNPNGDPVGPPEPPLPRASVASVTIAPDSVDLFVNEQTALTVTVRDSGGEVLTGRAIVWTSSNIGVAPVHDTSAINNPATGTSAAVTGLSEGGVGIVASSEGVSDTALVNVFERRTIAYFSRVGDCSDNVDAGICILELDSSSGVWLTRTDPAPFEWSPDGSRLAFTTDHTLYAINSNGTGLTLLSDQDASTYPSWSPNSSRVVFRGSLNYLHIVNADGTGLAPIVAPGSSTPIVGASPAWSPDGLHIAYHDYDSDDWALINVDGSWVCWLTDDGSASAGIAWAPNGQKLVMGRSNPAPDSGVDIWVVNRDGSGKRRLTFYEDAIWPRWSSDGRRILFYRVSDSFIYSMNADGTVLRPLVSAFVHADWKP
jgi:hypothetical protein